MPAAPATAATRGGNSLNLMLPSARACCQQQQQLLMPLLVLLLLLCAATGDATRWTYHAWAADSNRTISSEVMELPDSIDDAALQICSTLSSATANSSLNLLALSVSSFHPAAHFVCNRANVTCVNWQRSSWGSLPPVWQTNSVSFFPTNRLVGELLFDLVTWMGWRSFVVVYESESALDKYKHIVDRTFNPVTFRKVNTASRNSTYAAMQAVKDTNIHHILLDVEDTSLNIIFTLAAMVNATGLGYDYVHVGTLNKTLYSELVAHHMLTGTNATSISELPLEDAAAESTSASEQRRLAAENLIRRAIAQFVSTGAEFHGAKLSTKTACDVERKASTSIEQHIRSVITDSLGSVDVHGETSVNFSFSLMHMYSDSLKAFANWSQSGGFVQIEAAGRSHSAIVESSIRRRNLSVVVALATPFVMRRTKDSSGRPATGNDRWYGLAIELFDTIARRNGFSYHIHEVYDGNFGAFDGVAWNGMVKELMDGAADVAVSSITINYHRETVIDFTTPYMSMGLSVLMSKTSSTPDLFQYLSPFDRDVWLYTLLALAVFTLVIFVIARLSPYEWFVRTPCNPVVENEFTLFNTLWFSTGSLLQQGSELLPAALSTRIAGAFWWFFILVFISSYTANLAAFLTVKQLNEITSLAQLASQQKTKYSVSPNGAPFTFFQTTTNTVFKAMFQKMMEWNRTGEVPFVVDVDAAIAKVKAGGFAYITDSPISKYYSERNCSLTQVGEIFDPGSFGFGIRQGNAILRNMMTETILKLKDEQLVEEVTKKWLNEFNSTEKPCSEQTNTDAASVTLTFDAFKGLFLTLALGVALALLALVGEVCLTLVVQQRRRNKSVGSTLNTIMKRALTGKVKSDAYAVNSHQMDSVKSLDTEK